MKWMWMGLLFVGMIGCTGGAGKDISEAYPDKYNGFSRSLDEIKALPPRAKSNEIIIVMKDGLAPPDDLLMQHGYKIAKKIESSSLYHLTHKTRMSSKVLVSSSDFESTQAVIDLLDADSRVKAVDSNRTGRAHAGEIWPIDCGADDPKYCPNDPGLDYQWHLKGEFSCPDPLSSQTVCVGANVGAAWNHSWGDRNTPIVIIDRGDKGLMPRWEDLTGASQACQFRDFNFEEYGDYVPPPEEDHGFAVASIASVCTDNDLLLSSANWFAPVTLYSNSLQVVDSLGSIQKALDKNPNSIINSSYGYGPNYIGQSSLELSEQNRDLPYVWVASTGNEGRLDEFDTPTAIPNVISVGATNELGKRGSFSNYGKNLDIFAPGTDMALAVAGEIEFEYGTSFSAPLVSSIVSLVKSVYPAEDPWNWQIAKYLIQKTARPMSCEELCPSEDYLWHEYYPDDIKICVINLCQKNGPIPGLIDAEAAVIEAKKGTPQVAFVQTDKYYYKFDCVDGKGQQGIEVIVENTGFQQGLVKMWEEDGFVLTCRGGNTKCSKVKDGEKNYIELVLSPGEKNSIFMDPAVCLEEEDYLPFLTVETIEGPMKGYVDQFNFIVKS